MPDETYRGEGYERAEGCTVQAHFNQIQAICDALGHAAQLEMAEQIELEAGARAAAGDASRSGDGEAVAEYLRLADQHVLTRELCYGRWLGIKGVLRGVEMAPYDFTPTEKAMWDRIDWERETFNFPGKEMFPALEDQHIPGAEAT